MAYYVDLGLGTDGHLGTAIDPFSQNDFISTANSGSGFTFYLKGIGPWWPGVEIHFYSDDVLTSWPGTNLPWVLRANTGNLVTYGTNVIIENGVFHTEGGAGLWLLAAGALSYEFRNCRFDCTPYHANFTVMGGNIFSYKGCLLSSHRSQFQAGCVATLIDCVVTDDLWIEWDGATTVHTHRCAFKLSQAQLETGGEGYPAPATITYDNCQFSWTPPTFPVYTDTSRSSYDAAALYSGISTPPEPGTPPYLDYNIDPWGTIRNGIGFGAFSGAHTEITYLVPAPSRNGNHVRSQVNFPALMTHLAGDPTYFGTEAKIRRVDVHYYDPNMRERKEIVHMGYPDMHGFVAWTPNASAGTWTKQKIIVYDTENARHYIERSEIGSGEDVVL